MNEFANAVAMTSWLECSFEKVGFEVEGGLVGVGCEHKIENWGGCYGVWRYGLGLGRN